MTVRCGWSEPAGEVCELTRLDVNSEPFPHLIQDQFIKPEVYQELCESFPTCPPNTSPTGYSLYWGDADYGRLLDEHPAWRSLFNTFHNQRFIDWAREQFAPSWRSFGCNIDLERARYVPYREDRIDKERATLRSVKCAPHELWVRMDIYQGRVGYSRSIHLDHRRRLMAMLIYFCDQEENGIEGGELLLHVAEHQLSYDEPATRITPRHNLMVAFPCMNRSHHSVTPITSQAAPRNYVQVLISSSVDVWNPVADLNRPSQEEIKRTVKRHFHFGPHTGPSALDLRNERSSITTSAPDRDPLRVPLELEASRAKLLGALEGANDITVIRNHGNLGDHLIHAGMRRLLGGIDYREVNLRQLDGVRGEVGVITGSGAWCETHQHLPPYLTNIEKQFERVIIFPSSFDTTVKSVRKALGKTRALVFAREFASYDQIRHLCRSEVAHDTSFFFDFAPYRRPGRGTLLAFRTDQEAVTEWVPARNRDISSTCGSLDEFLWTIARHEVVRTDRAHVMIAAALLDKEVHYSPSNYHKLPELAASSLRDYPVFLLSEMSPPSAREQQTFDNANEVATFEDDIDVAANELERLRALSAERGRALNDILNSRSFRIISFYWRLRRSISQVQARLRR